MGIGLAPAPNPMIVDAGPQDAVHRVTPARLAA
jgi:hypothetical protein